MNAINCRHAPKCSDDGVSRKEPDVAISRAVAAPLVPCLQVVVVEVHLHELALRKEEQSRLLNQSTRVINRCAWRVNIYAVLFSGKRQLVGDGSLPVRDRHYNDVTE